MYNLGRGMWRRIGDFERIRIPQLEQQLKLQQYLAFIEFQKEKKRQDDIRSYRNSILQKEKEKRLEKELEPEKEKELEPEKEKELEPETELEPENEIDSSISVESDIINFDEPHVKIIPKKKRKKNK